MRKILLNILVIFIWICVMASGCGTYRDQEDVERGYFQTHSNETKCSLRNGYTLQLPDSMEQDFEVCIKQFRQSLNTWVRKKQAQIAITCQVDSQLTSKGSDFFVIKIEKRTIQIHVREYKTVPHALNWIKNQVNANQGIIQTGKYMDYSNIEHRALHLVMTGADPVDQVKIWIDSAVSYRFNTLIMQLTPGITLDGFGTVELEKKWSKEQFQDVVNYAKRSGLSVIPELTLLTKQNKLFAETQPEWLYNEQTYDPRNPLVYKQVFLLVDELIEICQPTHFHIGHDELHGIKMKPETAHVKVLPQSLFIQDVKQLHAYLQKKGLRTMMWSDMLLDPKLFPEMRKVSLLGINGYENTADLIPKDIIQCDWHYKDEISTFPTSSWLNKKGFDVWGATWDNLVTIDLFSLYMAKTSMTGEKGMIATTWHRVLKDQTVESLIKHAGNAFWKS